MVTLRATKSDVLEKHGHLESADREFISKKRFLRELDVRLGLNNLEMAERIARITLYLMSKRLSPEQKTAKEKSSLRNPEPLGSCRATWVGAILQHV